MTTNNYKVIVAIPDKEAEIEFNVKAKTEKDAMVVVNQLFTRQGSLLYCETTVESDYERTN